MIALMPVHCWSIAKLKPIQALASRIHKWTSYCGEALCRLVCFLWTTSDHVLIGYVGDPLAQTELRCYGDADFAGCKATHRSTPGMFACVRPAPGRRARRRPRGRAQYDPRGPVGRPRAGRAGQGAVYRAPNPAAGVRNCPPRSPPTREAFRAAAVPAPVPWWERPPKRADGVSVGIRRRAARLRGAQGSATDPLRRAGGPASPRGGPRRRTRCREDPHRRSPVAPRDRHQCARRLARTRSRVRRRRVRNMSRGAAPGGSLGAPKDRPPPPVRLAIREKGLFASVSISWHCA